MEFPADHGLVPDGMTSAQLWLALLGAVAAGESNAGGYNYALGNQAQPESLTIWHNGQVAVHVPANTGIAEAPTADGNFPVFARFRNQVMRGTNPGGSTYADPVQYVAYFNGGDAVHYIPRANYGIRQSLGCIELNLADAAKAWPFLAYGTIVSVTDVTAGGAPGSGATFAPMAGAGAPAGDEWGPGRGQIVPRRSMK